MSFTLPRNIRVARLVRKAEYEQIQRERVIHARAVSNKFVTVLDGRQRPGVWVFPFPVGSKMDNLRAVKNTGMLWGKERSIDVPVVGEELALARGCLVAFLVSEDELNRHALSGIKTLSAAFSQQWRVEAGGDIELDDSRRAEFILHPAMKLTPPASVGLRL